MKTITKTILSGMLALATVPALAGDFYGEYRDNYVPPPSAEQVTTDVFQHIVDPDNWNNIFRDNKGSLDKIELPADFVLAKVIYAVSGTGVESTIIGKDTDHDINLKMTTKALGDKKCPKSAYTYQCTAKLTGDYVQGCFASYGMKYQKFDAKLKRCVDAVSTTPIEIRVMSIDVMR